MPATPACHRPHAWPRAKPWGRSCAAGGREPSLQLLPPAAAWALCPDDWVSCGARGFCWARRLARVPRPRAGGARRVRSNASLSLLQPCNAHRSPSAASRRASHGQGRHRQVRPPFPVCQQPAAPPSCLPLLCRALSPARRRCAAPSERRAWVAARVGPAAPPQCRRLPASAATCRTAAVQAGQQPSSSRQVSLSRLPCGRRRCAAAVSRLPPAVCRPPPAASFTFHPPPPAWPRAVRSTKLHPACSAAPEPSLQLLRRRPAAAWALCPDGCPWLAHCGLAQPQGHPSMN